MNSLDGREWELYNFNNIGGSTEYDNLLINKDIDNYFNDIINKPISNVQSNLIKSNGGLNKFYSDYIEHNLIFIVVLIGIIIFLIIRHYIKDFDTFDSNKSNESNNTLNNNKINKGNQEKQNEKIKSISRKNEMEKIKLINYKKELDKEKQQILSIIDELSNINEYENNKYNNQKYLSESQINLNKNYVKDKDIGMIYSDNYNNNIKYFNQNPQFDPNTMAHNNNNINIINNEQDDISNYYDINKKQTDIINEIDGLYIEPPFM
jgi:hypothetical protein